METITKRDTDKNSAVAVTSDNMQSIITADTLDNRHTPQGCHLAFTINVAYYTNINRYSETRVRAGGRSLALNEHTHTHTCVQVHLH